MVWGFLFTAESQRERKKTLMVRRRLIRVGWLLKLRFEICVPRIQLVCQSTASESVIALSVSALN